MNKKRYLGLMLLLLIPLSTLAIVPQPAHALTKFDNCIIRMANTRGELTREEFDLCFHQQFEDSSIHIHF